MHVSYYFGSVKKFVSLEKNKYVNYSNLKKFSSNFKSVYNAPSETAALSELEKAREKMGGAGYPYAISNLEDASSFFQFPDDIRCIMLPQTSYKD